MPNTIAENLTRLQNARTAIANAITAKGGTVTSGDGFEDFPADIATISGDTATISQAPPIVFRSNGEPLVDWEIEGASGGVGERTKNYFPIGITPSAISSGVTLTTFDMETGTIEASVDGSVSGNYKTIRYSEEPTIFKDGVSYTISATVDSITGDLSNYALIGISNGSSLIYSCQTRSVGEKSNAFTYNASLFPTEVRLMIFFTNTSTMAGTIKLSNIMIRESSTSSEFEPYGYKIPVTCGGKTTDIFIGDAPLAAGETISKSDTNVDIPTHNGDNTLVVNTTVQPDNVAIEYYSHTTGIPYNTNGLCLYYAEDIGRVRIPAQTDHEPDISKLNSAPFSLSYFDDTTIEVRFTMPESFTDKARLIELGDHNGVILAINLNENVPEVDVNGTWAESFSTTFTGGETYTLSVTIGSGDIKLYVDGVYAEADTYTTFSAAGPIVTFCNGGAIGMDTRWFPTTSDISKIRVYDRVLTAAEIASNYQIDNPT